MTPRTPENIEAAILQDRLDDSEHHLADACAEIIELREANQVMQAKLQRLAHQLEEIGVLAQFWKSAAERALRLWDRAQDDRTELLAAIALVVKDPNTAMSRALWYTLEGLLEDYDGDR